MYNSDKPKINIKHKALDFLSRRDYSYQELYQKLLKYTDDHDEITDVLDEMVQKKFLNEERYIENFIASKSKKYGSLKLKYILNSKTENHDLVEQIYRDSEVDELTTATTLLQKKYRNIPQDHNERAKYIRFLLSRGFTTGVALNALKNFIAILLNDTE